MREIKFRAWDKMNGFLRWQHMIEEPSISQADIKNCRTINDIFKDEDFIFMQYTGLKDADGVEIYEGDIVSGVAIDTQGSFSYTGKIVWYENNVCLGYYIEDSTGGAWELKQAQTRISLDHITGTIIGNIYDNPELLEGVK